MNKYILCDIDGTLTDDAKQPQIGPDFFMGNALLELIRDLAITSGHTEDHVSGRMISYTQQQIFWDYPELMNAVGIDVFWGMQQLQEWHDENIMVYDDTVALLEQLWAMGIKIAIISNNPLTGCHMKLRRAGLEPERFNRIFGSNVLMGQKGNNTFWPRAVSTLGGPHTILASLGDHVVEDGHQAFNAGVPRAFLLDREGLQPVQSNSRIITVATALDVIPWLTNTLALDKCDNT